MSERLTEAPLADAIARAEAEVARLKRIALTATCADLGHDWRFVGGCACCCGPDGDCSFPVYECGRCGDCDYGENREADEIKADCVDRRALTATPDRAQDETTEAGTL